MKPVLIAIVAALALPLAACDSFNVSADQPLACFTLQPQNFTLPVTQPGQTTITGPATGTWSGSSPVAIGDAIPSFVLDGPPQDRVIHVVSFGLKVSGTGTTLDWLKGLNVKVGTVEVANYVGGLPPGATSINLPSSNAGANLADAIQNGNLNVSYTGSVDVPAGTTIPANWSGVANVCIQASVKKTFNQLINGN